MKEKIKFNVSLSDTPSKSKTPEQSKFVQRNERLEKLMNHLDIFVNVHSDCGSHLLRTLPYYTEV